MPFLAKRSIATQVRVALGLLTLLLSLGTAGLLLLARQASRQAEQVYRDHLQPMMRLMEVSEAYSVDLTLAMRAVRGGRLAPEEGNRILREGQAKAKAAWADYKASRGSRVSLQEAENHLARLDQLSAQLASLLPQGVSPELGTFGDVAWLPEVGACSRELQRLRTEEALQAGGVIESLQASSRRSTTGGIALMATALLLALGLGQGFATHLRKGVEALIRHLRRVADGNLEPVPTGSGQGELETAERELNRTVERLRQLMSDLEAQKALERAILDGAHAAIIGLDLQGKVSRWNRGAELMLGYSAEEVIGKATPMLWRLPEEMATLAEDVSAKVGRPLGAGVEALQAAASIPGFATECRYRARDGALIPVLLTISQVRSPAGELLGTMGVALDLRDLNRLREELRVSEARYRLLAERLPGVVYQTQVWPDGRRAWPFVSPQFERFYGVDAAALERDAAYSLHKLHPEDQPRFLEVLEDATRRLEPMDWEGRSFTERPGELKWVRVRRTPTLQADGSVLWDGLLEDITDLKRGEEALRRSEAQAQEASRAKSAFLASMSHELRTPLSAILGYSRLMARDPLRNEEDRVQLEHILKAGEHLLSLINDVLSLSKIEAGRMDVKRVAFDPAVLVRELESLFRLTALGKGLSFEVETQGLPAQVEGDPAKLRQVLVNLLGNALKFTSRGSVRLRVAWFEDTFAASVEDTGPGIPAEDLEALFGAFNQASLGSSAGGTGLGLHISQALMKLMGGTIGVSSVVGEGSRFHVSLPLPEPEVPALLSSHGRVLHLAGGESPRELLVVDDRPENRDILDRLLCMVGFRCSLAEHGLAALDQWRERRPDLILMDLRMPVMDGFEAVRQLRDQEREAGGPRTPVIAISASVYDVSTADLLRLGFDAFLTKPIDEEQLFSVLEEQLGLRFERAETTPLPGKALGLEALGLQDPDWRERFLEHVLTGDLEAAEALLTEIRDTGLAEAIRQRLRAYHLEDLLQHLR